MKNFFKSFLLCGFAGWCVEIIFTALQSLRRRDFRLLGTTSLWMFPIYGCGFLLAVPYKIFRHCSFRVRGLIYMVSIFTGEYISGFFLSKINACPWNYETSKFHIRQIIRLDYAPLWFLLGLFLEKIHLKYLNAETH